MHRSFTGKEPTLHIPVGTPYPSSRPASPARTHVLLGSTSQQPRTLNHSIQAQQLLGISERVRPSMFTSDSSSANSVAGRVGSKVIFEVPVESVPNQPQQLPNLYHNFGDGRASPEQRPLSMPDFSTYLDSLIAKSIAKKGTRLSHFNSRPPPYPTRDQNTSVRNGGFGGSVRQPATEDFFRPEHLPSAPSTNEHNSYHDLPVIEPEFGLHETPNYGGDARSNNDPQPSADVATLSRYDTVATANPTRIFKQAPSHRRSKSVLDAPSQAPSFTFEPTIPALEDACTPVRVPTMSSDMFSPALGGLHKISGLPKKETKLERVKQFWRDMQKGLSCWRQRRDFGRASRQSID